MRPGKATAGGESGGIEPACTTVCGRVHERDCNGGERIALVTTSWPANEGDPAGHFVRAHAREFEGRGHEVVGVAPRPGGAFGWPGVAARLRSQPVRALDAARWVIAARRQGVRLAPNRVVGHWAVPSGWPIGTAARVPLQVVSHGGDVRLLGALPRPARHVIVRTLATQAMSWSFASEALLRELLNALDRPTRALVNCVAALQATALDLPDVTEPITKLLRALGSA